MRPDERPIIDAIRDASRDLRKFTELVEAARGQRERAVQFAFEAGIHPLDVAEAAGVTRRTARDWQSRFGVAPPDES